MGSGYKPVKGFGGEYLVNKQGNVKRKSGKSKAARGSGEGGYKKVDLWKGNKRTTKRVHQLVAEAFVEKRKGKNLVNHKDGDKTNSKASNLEYMNTSENTAHGYQVKKHTRKRKNGASVVKRHSRKKRK